MSHKNLQSKRYNCKIGQRNVILRSILTFVESKGSVIVDDLVAHLGRPRTGLHKDMQELTERKFLAFSTENGVKGIRKRYTALLYTQAEMDAQLPCTWEMAKAHGFSNDVAQKAAVPGSYKKARSRPAVFRDPLDLALMGMGPAPSILFRRANANA